MSIRPSAQKQYLDLQLAFRHFRLGARALPEARGSDGRGRARRHRSPCVSEGALAAAVDQSARRLNGEIKRRPDVVAIFPNLGAAIVRLVGALPLEQNDEWAASRARYMSPEKLNQISDDPQARRRRIAAA